MLGLITTSHVGPVLKMAMVEGALESFDNPRRPGRAGIIAHARQQHGVLLIMLDSDIRLVG